MNELRYESLCMYTFQWIINRKRITRTRFIYHIEISKYIRVYTYMHTNGATWSSSAYSVLRRVDNVANRIRANNVRADPGKINREIESNIVISDFILWWSLHARIRFSRTTESVHTVYEHWFVERVHRLQISTEKPTKPTISTVIVNNGQ